MGGGTDWISVPEGQFGRGYCYAAEMHESPPPTSVAKDLLLAAGGADTQAHAALIDAVYAELKAVAQRMLVGERAGHTLSPTALVHEAYLRIAGDRTLGIVDRRQVFAVAARRMRQVLVDHARRRDADKRGGGQQQRVTLSNWHADESGDPQTQRAVDAIALEHALGQLEAADPRKVRVVELRYFAGLEMAEIAALLEISRATAQRDRDVARAFLYQALQ